MDQIFIFIRQFIDLFRFWIIVSPWEKAVRVRLGKYTTILDPGVHLRLPVLDSIFIQSIRLRIAPTDRQTLTSKDGKTITVTGAVGYAICDIFKVYNSLHHADDTITYLVRSAIAKVVEDTISSDLKLRFIAVQVVLNLDLCKYGFSDVEVHIYEIAASKTYRIIGDYSPAYLTGTRLSTESDNTLVK